MDTHAKIVIDVEDAYSGATRSVTLKHSELGSDGRPSVRERTLNVRIPKGVRPGQQIRLAGQGGPGLGGGPAGDLYLEVAFRDHPRYSVEGRDVYVTLPVAPWEAALGGKVTAPTPTGNVELTVPAGSQPGRKLRLKGRGLPGTTPGDLYVVLEIALPAADSDAARAAYRQFADAFDSAERVRRLVDEGIVEPVGRKPAEWRFTRVSVTRVRFAERVARDLDVNTAGAALALDLLDEIERLRARLRRPG